MGLSHREKLLMSIPSTVQPNSRATCVHFEPLLRAQIERLAAAPSWVLITGETGVGKGVAARAIHAGSPRANGPFIHVDCSALPTALLENELFGHERGAFTGAHQPHRGRFELAGSGTIFLDEVGDMDLGSQRRLLHVLEERTFQRIGGTRTIPMHARVIAGTNHDLLSLIASGLFRKDLYFRLRVVHLTIPPLRQRSEELDTFVRLGLDRIATAFGRPAAQPKPDFLDRLRAYSWPGNVRELFNVLEHVVVRVSSDRLGASDLDGILPGELSDDRDGLRMGLEGPKLAQNEGGGRALDLGALRASPLLGADEPVILESVLRATGGNVSRAARRLGLPRSTLRYRIGRAQLGHLLARD